MLVIAGLGNPGSEHAGQRHNVGFMAADAIARRHSFPPWTKKFSALVADGAIDGERVLLMKPQTYMNRSGPSVGEAMRFYKLALSDLVVIHDELDLDAGRLKVKTGGGAGGHNGLRSLDAHIGKEYRRARIGIGHPGHKDLVYDYVLGDFAKDDRIWLPSLLEAIAEAAPHLAKGEDASFMNKVTLATRGDAADPAHRAGTKPVAAPVKAESHLRQARSTAPVAPVPTSGPMAAMLKRLFGKD